MHRRKKFRETGSVNDAKKSSRPVSLRSPQNKETEAQFCHETVHSNGLKIV